MHSTVQTCARGLKEKGALENPSPIQILVLFANESKRVDSKMAAMVEIQDVMLQTIN